MCDRMGVIKQLQNVMSAIGGGCGGSPPPCCQPCCTPCCGRDAVLAVGQPPRPIAAFDKATIAIGQHGPGCFNIS
ncbi:unnamed protein product [Diatraea saccharalis]|uniref:Uncharacterized protein n=1 Tax=Diatraea saccharalis TaxID=40085 RepID=A0A9N9RH89_9NEOP|nr:unnamed protein product [Diatraea saccharalis]